jgi:hypothetical protein
MGFRRDLNYVNYTDQQERDREFEARLIAAIKGLGEEFSNLNIIPTVMWGMITGSIASQTDLITYLNGNYVPLAGTAVGFPITGNLELFTGTNRKIYQVNGSDEVSVRFISSNTLSLDATNASNGSTIAIDPNDITVSSSLAAFQGVTYDADYSANYNNRSLVDKEYVDTAIAGSAGVPAGLNKEVQYNDSGVFGGDPAMTFDQPSGVFSAGVLNGQGLTPSELVATNGSKNLVSLAVATYPSLAELAHVKGVTSAVQTQFTGKKSIATGNAYKFETTDSSGNLQETTVTASRAVATDANGLPTASATTATELGYVNGVTSAIQTQLNAKATNVGLAVGVDWSASDSLVGFSSTTSHIFRYSYDPNTKVCTCVISFSGTSDSTSLTATLPFTSAAFNQAKLEGGITNNGSTSTTIGRLDISASSNTITFTRDRLATAWTASSTKSWFGTFQYITA